MTSDSPDFRLLWAKTGKDDLTHPLICHLIDVAAVAEALWNHALTQSIRDHIARLLQLSPNECGRLVAFWVGLHDIGKGCPAFQRKHLPAKQILEAAGYTFPKIFGRETCYHGTVTARTLSGLLESEMGLSAQAAKKVACALGGHHGAWPLPGDRISSRQLGSEEWTQTRQALLHELSRLHHPPAVSSLGTTLEEKNALLMLLSGLTTTADWIGSMETYFPYVSHHVQLASYAGQADAQAVEVLKKLGWVGWQPSSTLLSFEQQFTFEPRGAQTAVIELAPQLDKPSLVIIEAPTGVGKTEAALYLADHWAGQCQQRGLYVAMPTQATSNQMYSRVQKVLARRYPDRLVNYHLLHGQARWAADMETLQMVTMEDDFHGGTVAAMGWFLPRKRGLLAPFAVGTVDQALLSVLQTRHFFVRLFGLSHKTIIFDEVHAYDTYMSTIFVRLLCWLRALGASVVVLSATLPARTRRMLLEAYAGPEAETPGEVSYPLLTWARAGQIEYVPLPAPERRTINLQWIARSPRDIARHLAEELRGGGCAAVICNTVGRAQETYEALRDAHIVPDTHLILFHARFPFAWRDDIERQVLTHFGKEDAGRPHKSIVVATQVIEQSLDLDFDLMISDLAPVDLILQRAGRLHRHARSTRPTGLAERRLLINLPDESGEVPRFGVDAYVYEPYVLLRSYLVLRDRSQITVPDDTTELIEGVYDEDAQHAGSESPAMNAALTAAFDKMRRGSEGDTHQALLRLVVDSESDNLLTQRSALLEEDSPELHSTLQALTRLGPPSVSLVCLHHVEGRLYFEPDGSGPAVDLGEKPSQESTPAFARHTLSVSRRDIVGHFLDQPVPAGWRDHSLLQNHRVAIFQGGQLRLPGTSLTLYLSHELGLEFRKEET